MDKRAILERLKPIELPTLPDKPLVSVLIGNYNYGQFIGEAIESVLNQTYQNFEIVICDDGSTDNSLEVIRRYAQEDSRIRYIAKENGGHASALNQAFEQSQGAIIAILDADDMYSPTRLEKVVKLFACNPKVGFVGHPLKVVDSSGRVLKDVHGRRLARGWLAHEVIEGGTAILPPASGISLRREVAEICFPLPLIFRSWADRALYERAALATVCEAITETLALYRQHGRNVTGAAGVNDLEHIRKAMNQVRLILEDRRSFLNQVYGVDIDTEIFRKRETREMAGLLCAEALLSGVPIPVEALSSMRNSRQMYMWKLLFKLPRPLAKQVFKFWWGEFRGKRWFRKLFPMNEW